MTATLLARESELLAGLPRGLWIGGSWRESTGDVRLVVDDPATGRPLAEVADADPVDAMAALDAACRAQDEWAATSPRSRGEILRRAFDAVTARADDLALLITMEMGKPLAEARAEVRYGAEFLRWFSEEAVRVHGRYAVAPDGGSRHLTLRRAVGPCLLITPWNFPLAMATRKIGPAIAAGCTMVLKPAAPTPLTSLALAEILHGAGLPCGVLNVVTTSRSAATTEPLLADPRLRKLSFTGSTSVGQALIARSAEQVLRVSMELGGNAPFLVFADADLDAAVEGALTAKMRNMGEACTAANRFLVHADVAAEFTARLADSMQAMRVGRGTDPQVQVGPMIDERARSAVADLVADAVTRGATVVTGAEALPGPGSFYRPTVLTDVPPDSRLLHEEIFGPVAPVTTFTADEEALTSANASPYGLAAYAYTRDAERALRIAEHLDVGMLGLNQGLVSDPAAPFGGVKASGFGREGGAEGIEEYLRTTYVGIPS